ncbi:MAG TPA: hypothetical protein VJN18_14775 [Polyangiaceae bacterium]|nr:hypothetical protein [Polyangiaceae bacterium]
MTPTVRTMRALVAKSLAGDVDPDDAHAVLGRALEQLNLAADALSHTAEGCGLKVGHLLVLRDRIAAVEHFVEDCCTVAYQPLGDDDEPIRKHNEARGVS